MTQKDSLRGLLLFSMVVMALAGLIVHTRVHPLEKEAGNIIPAVSGILSVMIIPLLFYFRRTVAYGYVLNGMTVILGTIAMTHVSLKHPPDVDIADGRVSDAAAGYHSSVGKIWRRQGPVRA